MDRQARPLPRTLPSHGFRCTSWLAWSSRLEYRWVYLVKHRPCIHKHVHDRRRQQRARGRKRWGAAPEVVDRKWNRNPLVRRWTDVGMPALQGRLHSRVAVECLMKDEMVAIAVDFPRPRQEDSSSHRKSQPPIASCTRLQRHYTVQPGIAVSSLAS